MLSIGSSKDPALQLIEEGKGLDTLENSKIGRIRLHLFGSINLKKDLPDSPLLTHLKEIRRGIKVNKVWVPDDHLSPVRPHTLTAHYNLFYLVHKPFPKETGRYLHCESKTNWEAILRCHREIEAMSQLLFDLGSSHEKNVVLTLQEWLQTEKWMFATIAYYEENQAVTWLEAFHKWGGEVVNVLKEKSLLIPLRGGRSAPKLSEVILSNRGCRFGLPFKDWVVLRTLRYLSERLAVNFLELPCSQGIQDLLSHETGRKALVYLLKKDVWDSKFFDDQSAPIKHLARVIELYLPLAAYFQRDLLFLTLFTSKNLSLFEARGEQVFYAEAFFHRDASEVALERRAEICHYFSDVEEPLNLLAEIAELHEETVSQQFILDLIDFFKRHGINFRFLSERREGINLTLRHLQCTYSKDNLPLYRRLTLILLISQKTLICLDALTQLKGLFVELTRESFDVNEELWLVCTEHFVKTGFFALSTVIFIRRLNEGKKFTILDWIRVYLALPRPQVPLPTLEATRSFFEGLPKR